MNQMPDTPDQDAVFHMILGFEKIRLQEVQERIDIAGRHADKPHQVRAANELLVVLRKGIALIDAVQIQDSDPGKDPTD